MLFGRSQFQTFNNIRGLGLRERERERERERDREREREGEREVVREIGRYTEGSGRVD